MPSQRAKGQKLVAFPIDQELLAALDSASIGKSRSEVVREAIYAHLKAKGFSLPVSVAQAPSRAGKGGRRPKAMNDAPAPPEKIIKASVAKKKPKAP